MMRYTSFKKYRRHLLRELGGVDEETKACAVSDTEEYLSLMVSDIIRDQNSIGSRDAFLKAVEVFGDPEEIAQAYRTMA